MFEAALTRIGVRMGPLTVGPELPSNEAVRAAIKTGCGATALSTLVVEAGIKAGTLTSPKSPFTTWQFLILHHKARTHSRAEAAPLVLIGARGATV